MKRRDAVLLGALLVAGGYLWVYLPAVVAAIWLAGGAVVLLACAVAWAMRALGLTVSGAVAVDAKRPGSRPGRS